MQGVPFFVFYRKYAVGGVQGQKTFTNTLEKAIENWRAEENPPLETGSANFCTPEGNCDESLWEIPLAICRQNRQLKYLRKTLES